MTADSSHSADPISRFAELLAAAARVGRNQIREPTAFTLATAGADGQPSARVVLLKGVDESGFVFYTNFESRKGRELLSNPRAALCFYWAPLSTQVRVEGVAHPVSDADADAYFASRARESQLGAWASSQSAMLRDDAELEARVRDAEHRFEGRMVPRPPYWSGFRVAPERIEFWHERPFRLHERTLYERVEHGWRVRRLYP